MVDPKLVVDAGALVLLGEPGIGKSTTFRSILEGVDAEIAWVDGAELTDSTFEDRIGRHLAGLPQRGDDSAGNGRLVVVIDQLDESQDIGSIAGLLRQALEGRAVSELHVLIGCRTADFRPTITKALKSSGLEVHLADLAPLTREQAEDLANNVPGVSGDELVTTAVEVGAGVLASVPLTLSMLVRTYLRHGRLEPNPTALFADGVRQLADEPNDSRRGAFENTTEQRVAVAERVAARLLLSARRTLWRGAALEAGPLDLNVESLVGGQEVLPNGSTVDVTNSLLGEALGTALFTGRGGIRLGFRHSSIAAYLAASHLLNRGIPRRQLESLFLVAGLEAGRTTIPTLLRETAAWLVTLDPNAAEWLVVADPESLSAHSHIVDSGSTRALLVESLLNRAGEVELSDVRWVRSPRRLWHEGLTEQLRAVFDGMGDGEPTDWSENARIRLAVRLARETSTRGLSDQLLRLAENASWNPYVRQLAALAAFETDASASVARLQGVLSQLSDVVYASEVDPDDELRGSLLSMLWPRYLSVQALIRWLRPRRDSNLIGSYWRFERTFPEELDEEDLPFVLEWAHRISSKATGETVGTQTDDPSGRQSERRGRSRRLEEGLLEAILDRVLSGPTALDLIPRVATLLLPILRDYESVPYPRPIDLVDDTGSEPESSRILRRSLALELLKLATADDARSRADPWTIINGWERRTGTWLAETDDGERAGRSKLLSSEDFEWVYQEAGQARLDPELREMLSQLAVVLFDVSDGSAVDLAYSDQTHPVWEQLRHWFEPVELNSERAQRLRKLHRQSEREHFPHPDAGEFVDSQRLRLTEARNGDTAAFWQLLWNLQFPPDTLQGTIRLDDDVLSFPGMAVFSDDDAVDDLKAAALHFLHGETDHRDEWLGTTRYDKRAWAGYLAFALLARQDELGQVHDAAWADWVGALVWFSAVPVNAGDEDMKQLLLRNAASFAAEELGQAAARYLRGELARGRLASEVRLINPGWAEQLTQVWRGLLGELNDALTSQAFITERGDDDPAPDVVQLPPADEARSHALSIWEDMLEALLQVDAQAANTVVGHLADIGLGENHRILAVRSALVLLIIDARRWWNEVHEKARQDSRFGRDLAMAVAGSYRYQPLKFDERQLGDVYRWLSELFPPSEDPDRIRQGAHFVGAEESARDWRDAVLRQLSERAEESGEAVLELARLDSEFPERLLIKSNLLRARALAGESAWDPPPPDELARLLDEDRRRLVRSNAELADVVLEILQDLGRSVPDHGDLLWDRVPRHHSSTGQAIWLPKTEASISAFLTNELRHRLIRHEVVVNREVLVRQTDVYGAGDRTDILVEATARISSGQMTHPNRVAAVLEVKGAWNRDVATAQREQLANRYLSEAGTDQGVYVVAWFPMRQWTDVGDDRRSRVPKVDAEVLLQQLEQQSVEIWTDLQVVTRPFVISIPRSSPAADLEGGISA
ncbi:MAG TPA: hypothetical protein VM848_07800 [Acidimicrobiia bacterium]|nr:hypothetical protein [Acidimicrobiia bacterium]